MNPITELRATTFVLHQDNIDTDQIIPARFLTTTERTGLGRAAFYDWRFDASGAATTHPLNGEAKSHAILIAGHNFGCGSSREHAPWALLDFGFRAVISSEIADIFRSNALKNGLLAIVVGAEEHAYLIANPGIELRIDLETMQITGPNDWHTGFALDAFARRCLMMGVDQLGYLLAQDAAIAAFERNRAA